MAQELSLNVQHITCWSSSLNATHFGNHIYSIEITEDMDNGLLVSRGTYVADEYEDEVWEMKAYAAGDEPLLLLNPPVMPFDMLKGYNDEDRYYNAAGSRVRAYTLRIGDRFALSEVAFDTVPAEKQYVTFDAGAKQYVVSDSATTGKFCAQVLTKMARTNLNMYKLQVVSL